MLPYVHCTFAFFRHIAKLGTAGSVMHSFPWKAAAELLNRLLADVIASNKSTPGEPSDEDIFRIGCESVPKPGKYYKYALPEDYAQRGLVWTTEYLPDDWFSEYKPDDEDRHRQVPEMEMERKVRILWLAAQSAQHASEFLNYVYDPETDRQSFVATVVAP